MAVNSRLQQPVQQTFTQTAGRTAFTKGQQVTKGEDPTVGGNNGPAFSHRNVRTTQQGYNTLRGIVERGNLIMIGDQMAEFLCMTGNTVSFRTEDGNTVTYTC